MQTFTHIKFPAGEPGDGFETLDATAEAHSGIIDGVDPEGNIVPLETEVEVTPDPEDVEATATEVIDVSVVDELSVDLRLQHIGRQILEQLVDSGLRLPDQILAVYGELTGEELTDVALARNGIEAAIIRMRTEEARDSQPSYRS